MIREHAFNTAWWGDRVGIVSDPAFFSSSAAERERALEPFAWVELRAPLGSAPAPRRLRDAGFFQADTQIPFRIGLAKIAGTPSLDSLEVCFADASPFTIDPGDVRDFEHERFAVLPGATREKLNARYVTWARQLISEHPAWCLEVRHLSRTQGWFLCEHGPRGLELTLAMLHSGAAISGMYLYHKALIAFASRGARMGRASFSAANVSVHNIYAALGAHFTEPVGCWMWIRP